MSEGEYRQVLKLLPGLSARERAGVLGALRLLGSAPSPDAGQDHMVVLRCLCDHLAHRGAEFAKPPVLARMGIFPSFKGKCPSIIEYLQAAKITSKTQQWAVLLEGFRILYEDLTAMGLATDGSMLMRHVHRLPALLNREYPGYAAGGYLHKVISTSPTNNTTSPPKHI